MVAEIGGKKIFVAIGLWQWHCRNKRKKKWLQLVCGNGIVEIEGKKKKKKMWQLICSNGIVEIEGKKNLLQLVCGNGIAEIEGKKKIVAMALLK